MKKNSLIALTGGIGSGKSLVLKILNDLNEKTLSCDQVTDSVYKNRHVVCWLGKTFPHAKTGKIIKRIDKKKIAKTVFNDRQKLKELTDFLTPVILEQTLKRAKKLRGRVFIEVPLLFECNAQDKFDSVIVVKRDLEERIKSVMARSNLTKEEVLKRIDSQFDYENADLSAYDVILNDKDEESLKQKVINLIK